MLKYLNTQVTFAEVPDEITLCINITGCKNGCKNCHSSYLAEDIGTELTERELDRLLGENKGVTCVCFMGGDADPKAVVDLAAYVTIFIHNMKVAWYSGRDKIPENINPANFDFIKIGSYKEELGPLTSKTTNQRFYKVEQPTRKLTDITYKFWKHETEN